METSSCYFHGLCDTGPLDRREESWSDPLAAGKKPVPSPFIRHWRICKGKSFWQPSLFPCAWNYGFVSVCASTWPFVQCIFGARYISVFLCSPSVPGATSCSSCLGRSCIVRENGSKTRHYLCFQYVGYPVLVLGVHLTHQQSLQCCWQWLVL